MKKVALLICLWLLAVQPLPLAAQTQTQEKPQPTRGGTILGTEAKPLNIASLYGESHALIIGIAEYDHAVRLPGVKVDVREVERTLKQHGFEVEVAQDKDLGSDRLYLLIKEFVNRHGYNAENRLLIYYAGHGYRYSKKDGSEFGVILPKDAPRPDADTATFLAKTVSMGEILASTKNIKAKHVLFIFDCCYAGSLINAADAERSELTFVKAGAANDLTGLAREEDPESQPYIPLNIKSKVSARAHQIIASGTYKQSVPDDSEFRRKFVTGLTDESGKGADLDGDSYVTVPELGEYLQRNVTNKSEGSQEPTWGMVGSKAANPGDFVFIMPGATAREVLIAPPIEPGLWNMPKGWSFEKNSVLASSPGIMLPAKLVRHSFRDFVSVTRLKLMNNTAAGFVLRAQTPQDYYLLQITGSQFPNKKERLLLRAYVVQGGKQVAELTGSPLPINERELVKTINYKDALQLQIIAEGNSFTVHIQSGEGNTRGLPLIAPVRFIDKNQTFRYGAPGFITADGKQLQIFSVHVYKLTQKEKGGI